MGLLPSRWNFSTLRLLLLTFIGGMFIGGVYGTAAPQPQVAGTQVEAVVASVTSTPTATLTLSPTPTFSPTPTIRPQQTGLSNDKHYINSEGNKVHSPAYSNSFPSGASAICGDGTSSFFQSSRGTCSHHGGVAQWL